MGLGGRREKQIIAADPRNTRWLNDTSSPGHRLLTGMGYDPANANSSQNKTGLYAHESSKRLKQIPMAKAGMEGIGFKPNGPGANVALGALPTRMTGGPGSLASAASSIFSKLGSRAALQFVTAGASKEVINKSKTEGGEFGGLLARLNAAASASATPEPVEPDVVEVVVQETIEVANPVEEDEDAERQRKKQRKLDKAAEKAQKKEAKLAKKLAKLSKEQTAESGTDSASVSAATTETTPIPTETAVRMQHWNASRSRNLRAKRMLHASADAMAEILGIAPTPSPSVSGYSTPTSLPATIPTPSAPSISASPAPQISAQVESTERTEMDAGKLRRKAEKKAAKALRASESAMEASASEVDAGTELKKKKRKRDA